MSSGTVTITAPAGRRVYLNGNYNERFPKVIEYTFVVDYGENYFETLTDAGTVDYRKTVTTDAANRDCRVTLDPVLA